MIRLGFVQNIIGLGVVQNMTVLGFVQIMIGLGFIEKIIGLGYYLKADIYSTSENIKVQPNTFIKCCKIAPNIEY